MALLNLKPERLDVGEFDAQPISLSGRSFRADRSGALFWPAEGVLIVADMHLGKGASYARRGVMLPPYDTRETLAKLAEVLDKYDATTVISLGDSVHEANSPDFMSEEDLETLRIIQEGREWIWVTGNHDPSVSELLGGYVRSELRVGGLSLRHEPRQGRIPHEIAGHLHPAAKISMHGCVIRRPCFVSNGLRLVLPAFGAFTGGLNVLDAAFQPLFGNDGVAVWMMGQEGLYPVAPRLLRED